MPRVDTAMKLLRHALLVTTALVVVPSGKAEAHTVSIGYQNDGPGTVSFWYGSYHDDATFNEGSLHLVGPSVNTTVLFSLLTATKPSGLVDGVTNFYSNGTTLVGSPVPLNSNGGTYTGLASDVFNWQGSRFSGLRPGTYTFSYVPIANPTFEWDPIDNVILTNTFTLSAYDILGIPSFASFGTNQNQVAVGQALDTAISGGAFNQSFYDLAALPPGQLGNALGQLSGENSTQGAASTFQNTGAFLAAMLDPSVMGRGGPGSMGADFGNMSDITPMSGPQYGGGQQYGSGQYGDPQYGDPAGTQYGGGQYGAGQYGGGQYGNGQYGSGQYGSGQYGNGQYGEGRYGEGQYGSGQYGNGQYGSNRYGNSRHGRYGDARCDTASDQRYGDYRDPACGRRPFDNRWGAWTTPYGVHSTTRGDAVVGSHDTRITAAGMIGGLDYRVGPGTVIGVALAGGGTGWTLSDSMGTGSNTAAQVGLYGSHRFGAAYVSAALAYAWYQMSTLRSLTAISSDELKGSFSAKTFGGRIETGYRIAIKGTGVTPYAALQMQRYQAPGYGETANFGTNDFALDFAGRKANDTRIEVGAWIDRSFAFNRAAVLVLRGRGAWVHETQSDAMMSATFQNLPDASFNVLGVKAPPNAALATLAGDLRFANGVSVSAKVDAQFAKGSQVYTGMGTLRYQW